MSTQYMIDSSSKVKIYVIAILILCAMAIFFVLGITLIRPTEDNLPIIGIIIGLFTPLVAALIAGAMKENHDAMNSRLTQLLLLTEKAAHAEGKLDGSK